MIGGELMWTVASRLLSEMAVAMMWKRVPPRHAARCEAITLRNFRCINTAILITKDGRKYCGQHSGPNARFIAVGQWDYPPTSPKDARRRIKGASL